MNEIKLLPEDLENKNWLEAFNKYKIPQKDSAPYCLCYGEFVRAIKFLLSIQEDK